MRRAGSTLAELKEVMASEEKTYILQRRPKAAGPIEKAVRKYRPVSVLGEREISQKLRVINLFSAEKIKAVIWNPLGEGEEREVFIKKMQSLEGSIAPHR
jgi:hypothetical protein